MQIRHVKIEHFRGISQLEWIINSSTICLIGPNDSCKSTILDAIEYALSPRWIIPFSDTDFFQADTSKPIIIIVTVGQLPEAILTLNKFGGHLRGWQDGNKLVDEPSGEDEPVISIRLRVDDSLEPEWHVINDREPEGKQISSKDRESLSISRLSSYVDRDLTWSRGSALSRITSDLDALPTTLAKINRAAKQTLSQTTLTELEEAIGKVQSAASQFGVKTKNDLRAAIDSQIGIGLGGLAIHDGNIPLRQMGLGSRRLLTASIQKSTTKNGAILLVDEIEYGLEPHRLRQFVRLIRAESNTTQMPHVAQTILITHSTIAICELKAKELYVVHTENGQTSITQVGEELQPLVRGTPEAFLARKIIVCEGKTETGMLRALDTKWANENHDIGFAYYGTLPINGGGRTEAPKKAIQFSQLGYEVLLFVDSDEPIKPSKEEVEANGVKVIEWDNKLCTEERICQDIPWNTLQKIIDLAIKPDNERSRLDKIAANLGLKPSTISSKNIDMLKSDTATEKEIREAISKAAKTQEWFKNITHAEQLGELVGDVLSEIPETDLAIKLTEIQKWATAN